MNVLRAAPALLLLACGGASASGPATTTASTSTAPSPSPFVGSFGARAADDGAHTHLVATEAQGAWSATLFSYALWTECTYTETPGTRTERTLQAHYECRASDDEDEDGDETYTAGETTLTLLANGHLSGNFGPAVLDLAPQSRRVGRQGAALEAFVGTWYGTGIVADEEASVTWRIENGALVGGGSFSFSDLMTCTFTEHPEQREPGRLHVHIACVCDYEHGYDFDRDCTLAQMADGIFTPDCFDDVIELTDASQDDASAAADATP